MILALTSFILPVAAFIDTVRFLKNPANHETNPLFGPHPGTLRIFAEGSALIGAELGFMWWIGSHEPLGGTIMAAALLLQSAFHIKFAVHNYGLPA